MLGPDQLDALERHMTRKLQERLQQVIAATFPELSMPSDKPWGSRVRTIVERGIESAERYGIQQPSDIAAFIALGLATRKLPPGTSTDWIREWLERPDILGPTKLAIIEAQLTDTSGDAVLAALTARVKQARHEAQSP